MQTAKSCSHFDKANTHLRAFRPIPIMHTSHTASLCSSPSLPHPIFTPRMLRASQRLPPNPSHPTLPSFPIATPIFPYWHSSLFHPALQSSPIGIPAYFTQHSNLPLLALHPILTGTPIYFNLLCYLFLPILRLKRSYTN